MTQPAPILIAEDDAVMAKLLVELLRPFGRPVLSAIDGEAVLGMVRELHPILLILDLNIPRKSGLEVIRALRRDDATRGLRILVITALGQPDTEDRVREAGADDFLAKPVQIRTILERVKALLSLAESPA